MNKNALIKGVLVALGAACAVLAVGIDDGVLTANEWIQAATAAFAAITTLFMKTPQEPTK